MTHDNIKAAEAEARRFIALVKAMRDEEKQREHVYNGHTYTLQRPHLYAGQPRASWRGAARVHGSDAGAGPDAEARMTPERQAAEVIAGAVSPSLCVAAGFLGCPDAGRCQGCQHDAGKAGKRAVEALSSAGLVVLTAERVAGMRDTIATLHNALNCIIHEEDNDPPSVRNAIRIARNALDEVRDQARAALGAATKETMR